MSKRSRDDTSNPNWSPAMNTSRRLDEKLTAVLIASWSVVLLAASVDTFCGRVEVPASVVVAQSAPAQGPAANVVVATAR